MNTYIFTPITNTITTCTDILMNGTAVTAIKECVYRSLADAAHIQTHTRPVPVLPFSEDRQN